MTGHTPGPWEQNGPNLVQVVDRFACPIEMASSYVAMASDRATIDQEQEANARLIAASPDLLAALKALLEASHNDTEHALANNGEHRGLPAEVVEEGWAAIAKAEGKDR